MERLDALTGTWRTTLDGAWFLQPDQQPVPGDATIEWFSDAFVVFRWTMGDVTPATSEMVVVIGRSDARAGEDEYTALYHDERGTCRVYGMTFDGRAWVMLREDPDMHQRFVAEVGADRIDARWEASDDRGATWRKDFDLVLERASA